MRYHNIVYVNSIIFKILFYLFMKLEGNAYMYCVQTQVNNDEVTNHNLLHLRLIYFVQYKDSLMIQIVA